MPIKYIILICSLVLVLDISFVSIYHLNFWWYLAIYFITVLFIAYWDISTTYKKLRKKYNWDKEVK